MKTAKQLGSAVLARYRGWRDVHAVKVLRRLRIGAVLAILATALVYLLTATEAHREIAAAGRTAQAIDEIKNASMAASHAAEQLKKSFEEGDVALTGTGTQFEHDMAAIGTHVTAAAQDNAAGADGAAQIQFVQGQLTTTIQLADEAVHRYDQVSATADSAALDALNAHDQRDDSRDIPDTGGLIAALGDLRDKEVEARQAQRDSFWLAPAWIWSTGLAPVLVLLLLVIATGRVTIQHFRTPPNALLSRALLGTASVAATIAAFGTFDDAHLRADTLASHPATVTVSHPATVTMSHPATVTVSLALLLACAVLAYLSYRPRLAEYRFEAR